MLGPFARARERPIDDRDMVSMIDLDDVATRTMDIGLRDKGGPDFQTFRRLSV